MSSATERWAADPAAYIRNEVKAAREGSLFEKFHGKKYQEGHHGGVADGVDVKDFAVKVGGDGDKGEVMKEKAGNELEEKAKGRIERKKMLEEKGKVAGA